ncbi:MAG: hypothetical protein LBD20_06090 [Spirochaetaceae bacterium]|jgi:hypothetical protein|nr:hypothetical protein [Spirochaetaceae bacterium]
MANGTTSSMLNQTWDSIVADVERLNALIGDKDKLREFGLLSHTIMGTESTIGALGSFIGPKVPAAEYAALRKAWDILKAKLDVFA